MTGSFLGAPAPNWDEIVNVDDDGESWADAVEPGSGSSCPGNGDDNEDAAGEEDPDCGQQTTVAELGLKH